MIQEASMIRIRHVFALLGALLLLAATGCGDTGPSDGGAKSENKITPATTEIAATVGEREFTMEEVDAAARAKSIKPFQELYEARKSALEQMIAEHLLDSESSSRGITRDELIQLEVDQKIVRPTAEDILGFYEARKAQIPQPLEEVTPQIRNVLTNTRRQTRLNDFLKELGNSLPVDVALKVPRVPMTIAANDPYKGAEGAPVRIVEYSDFQ